MAWHMSENAPHRFDLRKERNIMTNEASTTGPSAKTIIIAKEVPEEVQDCGKVRMGGAIKICWLTWEIFQYIPALTRYWPNMSC
jgi:homogentisate 1,2-dioxygenase